MDIALWVVQGLKAGVFLVNGGMKLFREKDALQKSGFAFVEDFSKNQVRLIGTVEILGAIGLLLPALVGVLPVLTPFAGVGLVLLMVGAAFTHLRRGESQMIVVTLVLLAMAAFIAYGRFLLVPFS